ncbi:glycosyl hydrolases family 18-domain-containing protein [Umbelopsis sp. AD052]|nr:glycosyl hydrolases family 18-domain-containing protein [Umbelopsis sp. AD052]
MKFTVALGVIASATLASASSVLVGYFPNWLYSDYPVSSIDMTKYTHINYAFAILNTNSTPTWTDPDNTVTQLPSLVTAAHNKNVKVSISVGGWTGCLKYSATAATETSRQAFIAWNIAQITNYNLDGVDLDWEYPGRQGAGCNGVDEANDASNYLTLLQELRSALDTKFGAGVKEITLAVRVQPFDQNGSILSDMSAYAKVVTRFNLMLYDINGAWNTVTGPNAPFNYLSGSDPFSFVQAITDWKAAKVPASQLVAGMAYYGRSSTALEDMTITGKQVQAQSTVVPQGDSTDAYWQDPYCSADPGGLSGQWQWKNMRSQGLLTTPTTAASPWVRYFDNVTQTPWLFNPNTKVYLSYDDPTSIAVKVNYAVCQGLAGAMVWDVSNDNGELLTAVNAIKTATCGGSGSTTTASTTTTTKATTASTTTTKATTTTTKATTTTKSTTVKTTTTTTTSASATATGSATCTASNNGAMVCVASGTSAQYQTCVNGGWLTQSCGSGTVCKTSGSSIYCDFP